MKTIHPDHDNVVRDVMIRYILLKPGPEPYFSAYAKGSPFKSKLCSVQSLALMYSVEDQQADREERMRDPMSASSTVDIIGNDTMEQKTYAVIVNDEKETNLQEANYSLLTCKTDDPGAAIETNELEEERPVCKERTDEMPAVMEGAEEVPRDNPIEKVNMAVCSNFKAYPRESKGDQTLPGNWPAVMEATEDVPRDDPIKR